MIQVICDICGEASQKPFGFRPENGLAFFGTEKPERYPYHLCAECAELIGLVCFNTCSSCEEQQNSPQSEELSHNITQKERNANYNSEKVKTNDLSDGVGRVGLKTGKEKSNEDEKTVEL